MLKYEKKEKKILDEYNGVRSGEETGIKKRNRSRRFAKLELEQFALTNANVL